MSIKVHYFKSHLDSFSENLGSVSDEQGERFHQDIKVMECYYQGRWDIHMIADYCWSLVRDKPQAPHKRKALKRQFAPITSCYTEIQSWKSKLFKSKDESISIIHTKIKELSIVDTRNKKQRIRHRLPKNFCWYFCIDYLNLCRNANKNFYSIFHKNALKVLLY